MNVGVILYGPPAAGKDTITAHLHSIDPTYVLFPRFKAGPGRTTGYRLTTPEALDALGRDGHLVWENARYDARYAIDRPELTARLRAHRPVVHLGQAAAVNAVRSATDEGRWLVVSVWCDRAEAVRRIENRATGDTAARLRAWDETAPLPDADLTLDTSATPPQDVARVIHEHTCRMLVNVPSQP